jgi:hypothetical protein
MTYAWAEGVIAGDDVSRNVISRDSPHMDEYGAVYYGQWTSLSKSLFLTNDIPNRLQVKEQ